MAWKIIFTILGDLPWMLLFLLRMWVTAQCDLGRCLGYGNAMILAILNLNVNQMLFTKFCISQNYHSVAEFFKIRMECFFVILNPISSLCHQFSFCSIQLIWEEMLILEFQDGSHCDHHGYLNSTPFAFLTLHVALMPPIKFPLNQASSL